jgi:hypothetical protein
MRERTAIAIERSAQPPQHLQFFVAERTIAERIVGDDEPLATAGDALVLDDGVVAAAHAAAGYSITARTGNVSTVCHRDVLPMRQGSAGEGVTV